MHDSNVTATFPQNGDRVLMRRSEMAERLLVGGQRGTVVERSANDEGFGVHQIKLDAGFTTSFKQGKDFDLVTDLPVEQVGASGTRPRLLDPEDPSDAAVIARNVPADDKWGTRRQRQGGKRIRRKPRSLYSQLDRMVTKRGLYELTDTLAAIVSDRAADANDRSDQTCRAELTKLSSELRLAVAGLVNTEQGR